MQNSWLTLLPPIIVLLSSLLTKRITLSLILGIISASFIANDFMILNSIKLIFVHIFEQFKEIDNYFFIGLIFLLGTLIALISNTGGIQALGNLISKKSKSKIGAETSSVILSFILFIDDYLSMLTVGHVMRPITDKYRIPRVKLAFFSATIAGALAIIIPISTWLGVILSYLSNAGISLDTAYKPLILADPFYVYLQSTPFIFYTIIIICSILFIIKQKISYGPEHTQEKIAKETGNLFGGKKPLLVNNHTEENTAKTSIVDFFVPIGILISSILIGIPYSGNYYIFGGNNGLLKSFQTANAPLVLFLSGIFALTVAFIFSFLRNKIKANQIPQIVKSGFQMTFSSVLLILLAWIFGSFLKQDLKTGHYLAGILIGAININFLPCMIFLVSFAIGIAIGSTWGTIAIMVPIIVPMIISFLNLQTPTDLANLNILFPCLGALFSGSVAGNHLSPISDSTIMSSSSVGAYATDLLKVRYSYTIPSIIATAISFLVVGFFINTSYIISIIASLTTGIILSMLLLKLSNNYLKK